jgi:glucose-6-phosphate isomerase, archaeal
VLLDLEPQSGLPVRLDTESCEFLPDDRLNVPSLCTRTVHELAPVWAGSPQDEDRLIYRYTSPLWFAADEEKWKNAGVGYGIVFFPPGIFAGEYVKSSGQYHAILPGHTAATPEIYTVLVGTGHFMLQRSVPPYDDITDVVMVEVHAGETFVVPPDYGHLQINPTDGPLVFSYTVTNPLTSNYEPYRRFHGAMYFEMASGPERFVFNTRYPRRAPLRVVKAADLEQVPFLAEKADYSTVLRSLPKLGFLRNPCQFPPEAELKEIAGRKK